MRRSAAAVRCSRYAAAMVLAISARTVGVARRDSELEDLRSARNGDLELISERCHRPVVEVGDRDGEHLGRPRDETLRLHVHVGGDLVGGGGRLHGDGRRRRVPVGPYEAERRGGGGDDERDDDQNSPVRAMLRYTSSSNAAPSRRWPAVADGPRTGGMLSICPSIDTAPDFLAGIPHVHVALIVTESR